MKHPGRPKWPSEHPFYVENPFLTSFSREIRVLEPKMTQKTPDNPKTRRSDAAPVFEPRPSPAKKEAGGKVSKAAQTFSVKSPRNRG